MKTIDLILYDFDYAYRPIERRLNTVYIYIDCQIYQGAENIPTQLYRLLGWWNPDEGRI